MAENPRDRDAARRLAESLATVEGLRTARRLQAAGLLGTEPETVPPPLPRPPEPISIWQPAEKDGEVVFVRPEPLPLGDHFAADRVLARKRSELPLRVVLFGESVAAGYLYAPHVTPARVLAAQLSSIAGPGSFEVVDLARTNETLAGMTETVRQSLQIQPDLLVLFTGNNWELLETPEASPYAPTVASRQRAARALAEGGPAALATSAAAELRAKAGRALGRIGEIARAVGIPVVVLLPEVNLADWENRQPVAWLAGDATPRWHTLYREALKDLDSGRFDVAALKASEMVRLDGGSTPTPQCLLARAAGARGNLEEALAACRAEVDSNRYPNLCFLGAPQATRFVRSTLLDEARRHGFLTVDLPAVFARHTGEAIPGRRLFLDYCHLTFEGMRVAMAAAAAAILPLSGMVEREVGWPEIAALPIPGPSAEVEATACLGAALHGSHRLLATGAKGPILEAWCDDALAASPGVSTAMLDLIAARAAPVPAVLTAAQIRNFHSPYRLGLQHGWAYDHLDADMIVAILRVLERRSGGEADEAKRLLLESVAPPAQGIELASPPFRFLWDPLERVFPDVMPFQDLPQRAFLRSPWPETAFTLVTAATADLAVELTVRVPAIGDLPARQGQALLAVNGAAVSSFAVAGCWTTARFRVPRYRLWPGLNRLSLRWPDLPPVGDTAVAAILDRLELGREADVHPIFGEVFSLRVGPAS
jgi:hypothetical protein